MDLFVDVVAQHRGFLWSCCVHAAHELRLFDALGTGSYDIAALATALGLPGAQRLAALVDVLRCEGVLSGTRDALSLQRTPSRPEPEPPAQGWGQLGLVLRRDRPLALSEAELAAWQRHMREVGLRTATPLFDALEPLPQDAHLLDLGCGLGASAQAFLRRSPRHRATLVDHPDVLGALALPDALAARATTCPGDALDVELAPGGFDLVLLSHVLHLHDAPTARALCRRAARWAREGGGRVAVRDFDLDEDRRAPAVGVYFALDMALYTERGTVHVPEHIAAWLREAGLDEVTVQRAADWPGIARVTGR